MSLVISPFYANISLLYPLANGLLAVAVVPGCSVKNVFIDILRNSHENTFVGVSFLMKLQEPKSATLLKRRLSHRCFHVNLAKFSRKPLFFEHLRK